jgi:hypothetical protein
MPLAGIVMRFVHDLQDVICKVSRYFILYEIIMVNSATQ